jgi:hypothetical protein
MEEERRFNGGELKRARNPQGEKRIQKTVAATVVLLQGGQSYQIACAENLKAHGAAAAVLLGDREPSLVIPLSRVVPVDATGKTLEAAVKHSEGDALDTSILDGGLLVTGRDRAVIAWQQSRAGRAGKFGMYDACAAAFSLDEIQEAESMGKVSVGIRTTTRCWELIIQAGGPKGRLYRNPETVTPVIARALNEGKAVEL